MAELKTIEIVNGLLNMDEASSYLGIKKSTLYAFVMKRLIPVIKLGKLSRFKLQDLEAFIDKNRQEASYVDAQNINNQ